MKKTLLLLAMILFSISTYAQCLIGDCNNGYGEKSYNGHIYKGNFLNGKRDGYGEYFWTFGDVYKGNWKNDDWDGYGERTYAAGRGDMSGVVEKGRWENGILVDPNAKPKINKPLVNKNNSNSQNKSVVVQKTNIESKTLPQSKKYKTPPLHLSTKELRAWYDSEDGQKYLNDSGLLKELEEGIYSSASRVSNNNNSNSSQKRVFICSDSDGCCKSVISSNSKPADGICNNRKTLKAGQIGHRWNEVGQQGNKQFKCNKCSIVVNTKDFPKGGGCCSVGGCSGGHSWSELK